LGAFGLIHNVHLEKKLDFKAPSIIGLSSELIAGIISIILAYNGFGVWALVTQTLLRSFVTTVLLWKVSNWRPSIVFSKNSLKSLFNFGSKILVTGIVQSIFQNIYYLIIGRLFQASALGYYTRASQFKTLPVNLITVVVQKVTFPVFSTIQDDHDKLISGYTKAIRSLAALAIPVMVFMFISSRPLIHIVLGEKWLPVVPYLQVMCLYGWIYVIHTMNNQVIIVKGRSDYYLKIQLIDKIFIVISILLTYKFGIMTMIYGHMVATVLSYLLGSFFLSKVININTGYQMKNIFPFIIASGLMLISSLPLDKYISNEIIYLISSVSTGFATYILILWILRVEELRLGLIQLRKLYNRL
jgi:teichuronic acid exporter